MLNYIFPGASRARVLAATVVLGAALAVLGGCDTSGQTTSRRQATPAPPSASTQKTNDHPDPVYERGEAGYYGSAFAGRTTASGEPYDPHALTAAHRRLPMGTRVLVTNLDNHRQVIVRINDRGPYAKGRIIDLSKRAARRLHILHDGVAPVTLRIVSEPDSDSN
jgi:rare lipoprotein A